jgi:hypothetical protein
MGAISEYSKVVGGPRSSLRPPSNLEDVIHWAVVLVLAFVALRILLSIVKWFARR